MVTTASADGAVIMVNHIDGVLRSTGARVRPFPPSFVSSFSFEYTADER